MGCCFSQEQPRSTRQSCSRKELLSDPEKTPHKSTPLFLEPLLSSATRDAAKERLGAEASNQKRLAEAANCRLVANGALSSCTAWSEKGTKGLNQDVTEAWESFLGRPDCVLCSVFDGHGSFGQLVARKARDLLSLEIAQQLEGLRLNCASDGQCTVPGTGPSWAPLLTRAFAVVDDVIRLHPKIDPLFSGSTAVVALQQGNCLVVANIGDSHAVLAQRRKLPGTKTISAADQELIDCASENQDSSSGGSLGSSISGPESIYGCAEPLSKGEAKPEEEEVHEGVDAQEEGTKQVEGNAIVEKASRLSATVLTSAHKCCVAEEKMRIEASRGRVFALPDEPHVQRIWLPSEMTPGLVTSRAFGDVIVKDIGVVANPAVKVRAVEEDDEFLVLASDGIWDVLSPQEAVDIVDRALQASSASTSPASLPASISLTPAALLPPALPDASTSPRAPLASPSSLPRASALVPEPLSPSAPNTQSMRIDVERLMPRLDTLPNEGGSHDVLSPGAAPPHPTPDPPTQAPALDSAAAAAAAVIPPPAAALVPPLNPAAALVAAAVAQWGILYPKAKRDDCSAVVLLLQGREKGVSRRTTGGREDEKEMEGNPQRGAMSERENESEEAQRQEAPPPGEPAEDLSRLLLPPLSLERCQTLPLEVMRGQGGRTNNVCGSPEEEEGAAEFFSGPLTADGWAACRRSLGAIPELSEIQPAFFSRLDSDEGSSGNPGSEEESEEEEEEEWEEGRGKGMNGKGHSVQNGSKDVCGTPRKSAEVLKDGPQAGETHVLSGGSGRRNGGEHSDDPRAAAGAGRRRSEDGHKGQLADGSPTVRLHGTLFLPSGLRFERNDTVGNLAELGWKDDLALARKSLGLPRRANSISPSCSERGHSSVPSSPKPLRRKSGGGRNPARFRSPSPIWQDGADPTPPQVSLRARSARERGEARSPWRLIADGFHRVANAEP